MDNATKQFVDFLIYSEKLKTERRHAHKSDGSYESAAEHCWRLSLLLILVAPKLKKKIDLERALKMATVHDLVEIDAADVPVLDHVGNEERKRFKDEQEKMAMEKVQSMLGEDGIQVSELWYEYLAAKTYEAKILHVLNMIEGQTQFLSESVRKFTDEDQESVSKLIEKTAKLSQIDPYLEKLYRDCGDLFRERTKPEMVRVGLDADKI